MNQQQFMSAGGGFNSPLSLRQQLRLWYDATDLSSIRLRGAAKFPGTSGASPTAGTAANCYLTTATANGLNGGDGVGGYASRTQLTVSFWMRHGGTGALHNTNDLNRHIIAKGYGGATFSGGSWAIATGDNFNEEERLAIWLWTNGTTGLTAANNTDTPLSVRGKWYHVVVVIDLSLATDALKVKMWVDGVQSTMGSWTGALPASIQNSAQALYLGRRMGDGHNDWGGDLSDLYIWSRALTGTEVGYLYNSGRGRYADSSDWSSLGLNSIIEGAWPLDEESGNRADVSGKGRTLSPGGANAANLSFIDAVQAVRDKRTGIWDAPLTRAGWMDWSATGLNSQPAFICDSKIVSNLGTVGPHVDRFFTTGDWPGDAANSRGGVMAAFRVVDMHTECPIFSVSNSADDDGYFVWMMFRPTNPGDLQWAMRMNADDEGLNANWFGPGGGSGPALNTDYIAGWDWNGQAAGVRLRQNGVDQAVSYPAVAKPANGDESWNTINGYDNFSMACWNRGTGLQLNGNSRISQLVVHGPDVPLSKLIQLEKWMSKKTGIALAA